LSRPLISGDMNVAVFIKQIYGIIWEYFDVEHVQLCVYDAHKRPWHFMKEFRWI